MFFKLNSIYRHFSQISLRLLTKKIISTTGNSLPLSSLTSSPLRHRKRGKNRIGLGNLRPTPFGIVTIERPEPKLKYSKITTCDENSQEEHVNLSSDSREFKYERIREATNFGESIDLMFPLLTAEELKAFDSSVYE